MTEPLILLGGAECLQGASTRPVGLSLHTKQGESLTDEHKDAT